MDKKQLIIVWYENETIIESWIITRLEKVIENRGH